MGTSVVLISNIAATMTVESSNTENLMEEKKLEVKEKKKNEEVKQFNFNQKPEVKHGWEGFLLFLWNPETGEFLGRTGMSWLKISVFYIIYYSFLTLFFMLMLLAFFTTLNDTRPSWDTDSNGIIDKEGKPCVLIKLNKIFKWLPEPYQSEEDFPQDLPQTIKTAFNKNVQDGKPELNNRVWLECDGENPADRENIGGITYYPTNGVSANFYPYLNQKGYLSPVVFARLDNPKHGVLIAVECKAWAKNIHHNSQERRGLVHFEMMID